MLLLLRVQIPQSRNILAKKVKLVPVDQQHALLLLLLQHLLEPKLVTPSDLPLVILGDTQGRVSRRLP